MAYVVNSNTIYISPTSSNEAIADTRNVAVMYVIITPTSGNAVLTLEDTTTTALKLQVRAATSGDTKYFDFSAAPIVFPTGITVDTLTNCVATLVVRRQGVN